jgi:hypothetical protein
MESKRERRAGRNALLLDDVRAGGVEDLVELRGVAIVNLFDVK